MSNPYIKAQLDNLNSDYMVTSAQGDALTVEIAFLGIARNYYQVFNATQDQTVADATLPQDDPNTPNSEGMTHDQFIQKAQEKGLTSDNTSDLAYITARVRDLLGKQAAVRNQADGIKSEIDDLNAIQEQDTSSPSDGSMPMET